jgi:hypothetical protein
MYRFLFSFLLIALFTTGCNSPSSSGGNSNIDFGTMPAFSPSAPTTIDQNSLGEIKALLPKFRSKVPAASLSYADTNQQDRVKGLAALDQDGLHLFADINSRCTINHPEATHTNPGYINNPKPGTQDISTQSGSINGVQCPIDWKESNSTVTTIVNAGTGPNNSFFFATNLKGTANTQYKILDVSYQNLTGEVSMNIDSKFLAKVLLTDKNFQVFAQAKGTGDIKYILNGVVKTAHLDVEFTSEQAAPGFSQDPVDLEMIYKLKVNDGSSTLLFESHRLIEKTIPKVEEFYINGNKSSKQEFEQIFGPNLGFGPSSNL